MLASPAFFCDECGAANPAQATVCFACNQPLVTASVASSLQVSLNNTTSPHLVPAPSPAGPFASGFLLARRYLIESQVGQGGFGVVYKAKDTKRRNKRVAVKQISLRALNAQQMIEATDSYNREITLLADLKHANLPRIYDHFTDPEHWYVVMDFIEGETLEDYLETVVTEEKRSVLALLPIRRASPASAGQGRQPTQSLPVKEVLKIGLELCQVLNYLHTRKPTIIFRDVKPANIMRTHKGHLYLIDFGIARQFTPGQTKDTGPLGSPGYAAPEQYGKAQSTVQTDIYGLGATLQTLVTGKDPLELSINGTTPTSGRTVPKRLQRLLDRMLERDASKRPKSVDEVKQNLQHMKHGAIGMIGRYTLAYCWGLVIGSFPYSLLMLMLFSSSLHVPPLPEIVSTLLSMAGMLFAGLICFSPILLLGQAIMGIIFLFSARKRVIGLGILTMVGFILLAFLQTWVWHVPASFQ